MNTIARAEGYLGIMYMLGIGVDRNVQNAEKLFMDAANQKNPEAEYSLGVLYSAINDHPKDTQGEGSGILPGSAARGYIARRMHSLGLLLVNNPNLSQQPGEAIQMLTEAATDGSWKSSLTLGILSRDGRYAPANTGEAYKWFLIAAQQGGPEAEKLAKNDLTVAKTKLDPIERDTVEEDAASWLLQHPHRDLFKIPGGLDAKFYPMDEVYLNDFAGVQLSTGANTN